MPITASKFSKLECRTLVGKIMRKVILWSTRSPSFAGRAQLFNTVVFGMYNFWATIFILPQEVIDQINQISRNYLWSGNVECKRAPYISWSTICTHKKHGGLGLKNLAAWNKASIAKLVWSIAMKNDILWVKWVHGKYLKSTDWWEHKAPPDCSWYRKKTVKIKVVFKHTLSASSGLTTSHYSVKTGYLWLLGNKENKPWSTILWSRTVTPRHTFTTWLFFHRRIPVKSRLAQLFTQTEGLPCALCNEAEETIDNLFFYCAWAKKF